MNLLERQIWPRTRLSPLACGYCQGTQFHEGPSRGMSTHYVCANPKCRHWFNYKPGFGLEDLHRVEPTQQEKDEAAYYAVARAEKRMLSVFLQGREIYHSNRDIRDCIHNGWSDTFKDFGQTQGEDIIKMAGWISEAIQDLKKSRQVSPDTNHHEQNGHNGDGSRPNQEDFFDWLKHHMYLADRDGSDVRFGILSEVYEHLYDTKPDLAKVREWTPERTSEL